VTEAGPDYCIRVGIIARETAREAWRVARERFPEDRKGQITHKLAMKVSDSRWHEQLSGTEADGAPDEDEERPNPYWLVPFQNTRPSVRISWARTSTSQSSSRPTSVGARGPSSWTFRRLRTAPTQRHRPARSRGGRPVNATLLQHYAARPAQSDPSKVALVMGDDRATYGELECDSNRLARLLIDQGCRPGDGVCLFTPKSLAAIVAMHATLKAGAAYVPIDPQSPAPRIAKILSAAEPSLALVAPQAAPVIDDLVASGQLRARVGSLGDAPVAGERVTGAFALTDAGNLSPEPLENLEGPESTAHILFTSGSTGMPKGVVISHANVVAFLDWAVSYLDIGSSDRNSGHPPLHFDLSRPSTSTARSLRAHSCTWYRPSSVSIPTVSLRSYAIPS
jgi:hypothetical protein